jgi:hypothetical protein
MSEEKADIQGTEMPFPPSWIDRLIAWIDRLPGPTWLFYVISTLVVGFLGNAILWIDGSMPVGSFDRLVTVFAIFVFYWLGLYHYLTRVGTRSLQTFRPLLKVDAVEFARIDYELAKLPRRLGWLAVFLGIATAAETLFGDPAPFGEIVPRTVLPYVTDMLITSFLAYTFFCVVIRSIRQMRMVGKLHAQATNINLLKLEPAHAFSALTARTGIGVLLLMIFIYFLEPTDVGSVLDIALYLVTVIVAMAVFVLPVMGMRDRLDKEKQRVIDDSSDLLQVAIGYLHSKVSDRDFEGIAGTERAINALIRERELLEKISTWPWDPRTIRGFASALLLPIFIWLVTRLLERFL